MDAKTVIRGGYGIFYTNSQAFLNNFVINRRQPPFAETQQITSSTATPQIDIANPFAPREVGHFLPDAPAGEQRVSSNDVTIDDRGLIYLIDRARGLDIIEATALS